LVTTAAFAADGKNATRGLIRNEPGAFSGYTIVAPIRSTTTYLVDMEGEVVHSWESEYSPTFGVHLLDNGNLLRAGHDLSNPHFQVGGQGGVIQEFTWDGEVVWEYVYSDRSRIQHHDIEILPNGNVLILAWERKAAHEALRAGRDPKMITATGLWPEHILEVRPTPPTGGEIVWEWRVWDHLIQDRDPELPNFGSVADHPELIDINGDAGRRRETEEEIERLKAIGYIAESSSGREPSALDPNRNHDWNHANSISYNPELDQIAISVLRFNEVWVIDHSTTIKEAAGHSGGRGGRGGDLLYRWGNPQVYRGPEAADRQRFYSQHDARWVPDGWPGGGNLTIFNNGRGRPGGAYSSVDEIRLPRNGRGAYRFDDSRQPADAELVWTFSAPKKRRFYSSHISGAERLPNGNTLICDGQQGRIFEVTATGDIVWDFLNPMAGEITRELPPWLPQTSSRVIRDVDPFSLLRASRIGEDHPGLARLREKMGN
jgi:hypothetical protein